jgi:MGT family glycosyltransferase
MKNKKILIIPLGGFLAHFTRCLEIGKALQINGFNVIFAGPKKYIEFLKDRYETHHIFDFNPEYIIACLKETTLYFHSVKTLSDFLEAELKLYEEVKPDIVLTDSRFSCKISCKIARIPLVSLTSASWTSCSKLRRTLPEKHLFYKMINRFFSKDKTEKIISIFLPYLTKFYSDVCLRPYNYFLRKHKIKRLSRIEEIWEGDLTLLCDIPEISPVSYLPPNFYYIGPIFWEEELPLPDWWNEIDKNKKTIYLTMGSSGDSSLFKRIVELLEETPFNIIISTGEIIKKDELKDRKNIFVESYLPGAKVMEISDVVIFHGGSGTSYQALSYGVPLIGIPSHFEQEWNINRLVELGAGIKLSERELNRENLRKAIDEILNNEYYKENVKNLQKIIEKYNSKENCVRYIKEFFF